MGAELMITGNQIRQARKLLGWPSSRLAQRAKVHSAIVRRAESVDGEPPITVYQAALIRDALGRFGIEFTNGDAPDVKLTATKARTGGKGSLGQQIRAARELLVDPSSRPARWHRLALAIMPSSAAPVCAPISSSTIAPCAASRPKASLATAMTTSSIGAGENTARAS